MLHTPFTHTCTLSYRCIRTHTRVFMQGFIQDFVLGGIFGLDNVACHPSSRGVWGHAPQKKFWKICRLEVDFGGFWEVSSHRNATCSILLILILITLCPSNQCYDIMILRFWEGGGGGGGKIPVRPSLALYETLL